MSDDLVTNGTPPVTGEEQGQSNAQQAAGAPVTPPAGGEREPEWLAQRLERERKKVAERYKDYEQLKAAAAELQKIKDQQKTEQERLAEQLAALQSQKAEAERMANEARLRAALTNAAVEAGMAHPTRAYDLVDLSTITLTEDGVEGAAQAVAKLLEQMPELRRRQAPTPQPINPPQSPTPNARTDQDRMREYFGGPGTNLWSQGRIVKPEE